MDHDARIALAHEVTDSLRRRHPDLVAVWIEGSTAKAEDLEHSDLEMAAVTREASDTKAYSFIHEGIVVEVALDSVEGARKRASAVNWEWPVAADGWVTGLPTYDPEGIVPELAALAANPDPVKAVEAARGCLTSLYEDVCKLRNLAAAEDHALFRFQAVGLAYYGAARFLGLLNGKHYNGTRNLLTKPRDFALLPEHFWVDYPRLLTAQGTTADLLSHAERLYSECKALFESGGHSLVEGLPLEEAMDLGRWRVH